VCNASSEGQIRRAFNHEGGLDTVTGAPDPLIDQPVYPEGLLERERGQLARTGMPRSAESLIEKDNRFDMKRLRKEVEQMHLLNAITGRGQRHKVPRQRSRIARHIANL
jgi:hypothetical protein